MHKTADRFYADSQTEGTKVLKLDPRIQTTYDEAPRWGKLIILLVLAIACQVVGKTVDTIFSDFTPKTPNWRSIVAGHPLLHWSGKTQAQIRSEVGDGGLTEVLAALAEFGIVPEPEPIAYAPPVPESKKVEEPKGDDQKKEPEVIDPGVSGDQLPEMIGGVKVSELAGKKVKDLLKIEGMSPAAAKLISAMKPAEQKPADPAKSEEPKGDDQKKE